MNLDDIGVSTVKDSTAFKKIQFFSKIDPSSLFNTRSDFQHTFNKLGGYYNNDTDLNYSYSYGMDRQHNYTSLSSTLPLFSTLLDSRSVDKFLSYNFSNISGRGSKQPNNNLSINRLSYGDGSSQHNSTSNNYTNLLPDNLKKSSDLDFQLFLKSPSILSVLNAETDSKQLSNTFKFSLNFRHKKKLIWDLQNAMSNLGTENLTSPNATTKFISQVYNTENLFKFKDLKSSNAQFLGSERTVRLLNNLNSNSYKWNSSSHTNTADSTSSRVHSYGNNQSMIYNSSLMNWLDYDKAVKHSNNLVWMPTEHSPIMSSNPYFTNTSFDFFEKNQDDVTPMVLRSKEESAPSHTFNTY